MNRLAQFFGLMLLLLSLVRTANAQLPSDAIADPVCPDASIFSASLITDICWDCIFPIRFAGVTIAPGDAPSGAVTQPICLCNDNFGVPHVGVTMSMWQPARLIEVVRNPGCSPVLGGLTIPTVNRLRIGTHGSGDYSDGDRGFAYFHMWSFPLVELLNLFSQGRCNQDGYVDLDAMYLSELDPTWTYEELTAYSTPEVALIANPVAVTACIADALASNVDEPIDTLFWCAGSWGTLYPLSGRFTSPASRPKNHSLIATRALAALHRRGLSWRTMGRDTLCRGKIDLFLPKRQYRMSMWFPWPEVSRNHVIGETPFTWGEWRNRPDVSDSVYLVWRWVDCCSASR